MLLSLFADKNACGDHLEQQLVFFRIILKSIPFQIHSLFQFGLLAPYNVQNATARVESHFGEPSQGNLAGQQGRLLQKTTQISQLSSSL